MSVCNRYTAKHQVDGDSIQQRSQGIPVQTMMLQFLERDFYTEGSSIFSMEEHPISFFNTDICMCLVVGNSVHKSIVPLQTEPLVHIGKRLAAASGDKQMDWST